MLKEKSSISLSTGVPELFKTNTKWSPRRSVMTIYIGKKRGNFRPLFIAFSTICFRFFMNSFVLIPCLVPFFDNFMTLASDVTRDVDDDDLCSRQHFFEKDHQIWPPWTFWPRFWDYIFSSIFFSNASDSRFHLVKLSWQIFARRF